MSIQVKFFASLRERAGRSDMSIAPAGIASVGDVWAASADFDMPANTLAAINHEYVNHDAAVNDGDEVAFFPPVTGG